jgi:hypothetical protein
MGKLTVLENIRLTKKLWRRTNQSACADFGFQPSSCLTSSAVRILFFTAISHAAQRCAGSPRMSPDKSISRRCVSRDAPITLRLNSDSNSRIQGERVFCANSILDLVNGKAEITTKRLVLMAVKQHGVGLDIESVWSDNSAPKVRYVLDGNELSSVEESAGVAGRRGAANNQVRRYYYENPDSYLQCRFLGILLYGHVDRWASNG